MEVGGDHRQFRVVARGWIDHVNAPGWGVCRSTATQPEIAFGGKEQGRAARWRDRTVGGIAVR